MTEATTVLVVDDDTATRHALGELLVDEGFQVIEASDGDQALQKLSTANVGLVVTDLEMPQMGGEELIQELAQVAPKTPVIVLTSHQALDARREAARLGAAAYVNKPLDLNEMLRQVVAVAAP